jgi:2-keto-4-pentenoate hydratase/2-oxohepta-3-ene-1,7-dioic acid hydratase in catechol pathway
MRIARFQHGKNAPPAWGWISGDRIGLLDGDVFGAFRRKDPHMALDAVRLLAPVLPGKVIAVGYNFKAHSEEHTSGAPALPLLFLKAPSALLDPGRPIILPPQSAQVEHEAELAVIIGRGGRWIQPEQARHHVLGYTAANDVTARDLQQADGQWTRGKSFDTFLPLGPWIETELDPADVLISGSVNGQMRQMASTRDMVFSVPQLIAFVSSVMTLSPGDVLLTGTPAGVGPLLPGDSVSVEIEGIGILTNPVRTDSHPTAGQS